MNRYELGVCYPNKCIQFPHSRDCNCECHQTSQDDLREAFEQLSAQRTSIAIERFNRSMRPRKNSTFKE
jgi:hypothetical protein